MSRLAQKLLESESLIKQLYQIIEEKENEIKQITKQNKKLNQELEKKTNWAELRNKQVGQLINSIENITQKSPINQQISNLFNEILKNK